MWFVNIPYVKHRAKIFQIFKKVGVKLYQIFHEINDLKGTLGNLL